MALSQHRVDQRRLAMVDMSDDRDITDVVSAHSSHTKRLDRERAEAVTNLINARWSLPQTETCRNCRDCG
jgi:hypothetical protein